jgi:hypothetical protein
MATVFSRRPTGSFIFYQEATRYWAKVTIGLPYYAKNAKVGAPAHGRYLYFDEPDDANTVCAILNSNLFYLYFVAYGDCFHLSDRLVSHFPVVRTFFESADLKGLNGDLMSDLKRNAQRATIKTSGGDTISYDEFYVSQSKTVVDEIDRVLAQHYGFTVEELDFLINYDINYRMGRDAEQEE